MFSLQFQLLLFLVVHLRDDHLVTTFELSHFKHLRSTPDTAARILVTIARRVPPGEPQMCASLRQPFAIDGTFFLSQRTPRWQRNRINTMGKHYLSLVSLSYFCSCRPMHFHDNCKTYRPTVKYYCDLFRPSLTVYSFAFTKKMIKLLEDFVPETMDLFLFLLLIPDTKVSIKYQKNRHAKVGKEKCMRTAGSRAQRVDSGGRVLGEGAASPLPTSQGVWGAL